MKKKLFLWIAAVWAGAVFGQTDITDKFIDENFRKEVYKIIGKSFPAPIYDSDVSTITELYLEREDLPLTLDVNDDLRSRNIASLAGIEYFVALEELDCSYHTVTALNVSSNHALTKLDCSNNQLTALDVSNNPALTELSCGNNRLLVLDVSNNPALTELHCSDNRLYALDVSNNPALTHLYCSNNQLTALDVSNNPALDVLFCYGNQLTALDVSNNPALDMLFCDDNQLTVLDVSGTAVRNLDCRKNYMADKSAVVGFKGDSFNFSPQITSNAILTPNHPATMKSKLTLRQNGKMLRLTLQDNDFRSNITLYTVSGKQQKIKPLIGANNTISISLSHLAKGVYILRVNGEREQESWKGQIVVK